MEPGFLAAESFVGGGRWTTEEGRFGARGPIVRKPDRLGTVYLAGFRCPGCRFLSLRYWAPHPIPAPPSRADTFSHLPAPR